MPVELRLSNRLTLSGVLVAVLLSASSAFAGASEDCAAASSYNEVLRLCRPLAEQGDPNAQFKLGLLYAGSFSSSMDLVNSAEALKWTRRAAEQGLVKAQHRLGFAYLGFDSRLGVPQDYAEAA